MRTQREFFAALAKCRNGWDFRGECIRHGSHCPITAVVAGETGKIFHNVNYLRAAETVGLPEKLAERLVVAADFNRHDAEPRLRKRILAVLGLSE